MSTLTIESSFYLKGFLIKWDIYLERVLQKQPFGGILGNKCSGKWGNNPWKIPMKR